MNSLLINRIVLFVLTGALSLSCCTLRTFQTISAVANTIEVIGLVTKIGSQAVDLAVTLREKNVEKPNRTSEDYGEIMNRLDDIGSGIDSAAVTLSGVAETLHDLQHSVPVLVHYQLRFDTLVDLAHKVDEMYRDFMYYTKATANQTLERHTLEDFAHHAVSHGTGSLRSMLSQMHTMLLGYRRAKSSTDRGLLRLTMEAFKEPDFTSCSISQSPQQMLYNLYNLVAVSEVKGYAMMQFSWMILRQYEKGNFTREVSFMQQQTEQRAVEKGKAARNAMRSASRSFWQCDPKIHQEGSTYIQLTSLLQGHLQNEVDLNPGKSCKQNCAYYSYTKVHGCYHNLWCSKQKACNGRLFNCQFIDADAWICLSNKNTHRRYDYIEYENGRRLGKKDKCSRAVSKVDSWWRWVFWHCSYCFCLCDDPGLHSDRYFSLRPVLADVSGNRVITGLQFVKAKRVIHIQIQEGKVLPGGTIDSESVRWRPVDSFQLKNAAPGVDYHTMTFEQRAIDLDDLMAADGYALTGIRFRRIGSHLNHEILVTPLDMESGMLKHDGSFWFGNDNTAASIIGARAEMSLSSPDVPILTNMPSQPDSKTDQYVQFTNSDINKDAAQTTVPFLDAQPVAPSPPTLLSGAGIYHKGRVGYGGFVALRLTTFDFSSRLGLNSMNDRSKNSSK